MSPNRRMQKEIAYIRSTPEWQEYIEGDHFVPQWPAASLADMAVILFYLQDIPRAKEISDAASKAYMEEVQQYVTRFEDERGGLRQLFEAALFRNLAGQRDEARLLWERLVHLHQNTEMDAMQGLHKGNGRMWVAYALLQLGRYDEMLPVAQQAHLEILLGHGINQMPTTNSQEFYLSDVLITLAACLQNPSAPFGDDAPVMENRAIDLLAHYADNNRQNYQRGYGIIFDLQQAFQEVYYRPVLPGDDPSLD